LLEEAGRWVGLASGRVVFGWRRAFAGLRGTGLLRPLLLLFLVLLDAWSFRLARYLVLAHLIIIRQETLIVSYASNPSKNETIILISSQHQLSADYFGDFLLKCF
jgi:hypothetical protein